MADQDALNPHEPGQEEVPLVVDDVDTANEADDAVDVADADDDNHDDDNDDDDDYGDEHFEGYGHSRYRLALAEMHHSIVHGGNLTGFYLAMNLFHPTEFYDNSYREILIPFRRFYNFHLVERILKRAPAYSQNSHEIIRNYERIVKHPSYAQLNIVQTYNGGAGELLCVLKTVWLRVFQRMWKKYYENKIRWAHYRDMMIDYHSHHKSVRNTASSYSAD
jgi:hypothetical protein